MQHQKGSEINPHTDSSNTNIASSPTNIGNSGGHFNGANNIRRQRAAASTSGADMSSGMNRVLAHSTSLLANDSYIAGMSSDSELTSSRHHHRPYSSQSRVYHAHPAPRSSHNSSRVSHYSDSAATTYVPSANKLPPYADTDSSVNSSASSSINNASGKQQQQPQQQYHSHSLSNPHLTPQGSLPSSVGLVGSPAGTLTPGAYYQPAAATMSDMSAQNTIMSSGTSQHPHQQHQGTMSSPSSMVSSRPLVTTSGRQLPHRPFKQSLSIDHYNTQQSSQHQQHMIGSSTGSQRHHHHLAGMSSRQPISPHHFDSVDMSSSYQQQQPSHLDNQHQQQQRLLHHDQMPRYDQRGFRSEISMIEKQTAALRLYDSDSSGLPPIANRAPSSSSPRHLSTSSPVSSSGQSLSSIQHSLQQPQQQQQQQYHALDHQSNQPSHLARKPPHLQHHSSDLYASHLQYSSSPTDWLPPIGLGAPHHLNRSSAGTSQGQFKQTMSIDHYPVGAQQQQLQFYSPNRQGFRDHYRSLGYSATNSPVSGYTSESPSHQHAATDYVQQQQQQQQQHQQSAPGSFDNQTTSPSTGDIIYHQYTPNRDQHHHIEQRSNENTFRDQQRQFQESNRYSTSSALGYTSNPDPSTTMAGDFPKGQQQLPSNSVMQQSQQHHQGSARLPHQLSSSSSGDSRSGSLKSADMNRSSSLEQQGHKSSSSLPHSQQQSLSDHHQQHQQQQQQHQQLQQSYKHHQAPHRAQHAPLRKGYTSVVSSLGGSVTALNESPDLSPSHGGHMLHLTSSAGAGVSLNKRSGLRAPSPSAAFETSTSTGRHQHQQHHHSTSGTSKEMTGAGSRSESSTGLPNGGGSSTLTKKSNSATQLSMTGTKKRLGFRRKQVTSFSVHRSEEVAPLEARHLVKQGSSVSEGDSSMSGDSSSRSWSNSNFKQPTSDELASMNFIDGLGKGQMISRQGLASPYLGDIQLSLCDRRGNLEVEIIRARNLQAKTNKVLPLTYVKLYLVKNRKCLAKAKTTLSNKRTLDPLFQQQLTFHEDYHGCILQSIIWGNFGKMDKKNFMGIAQISIDDLELSETVISWYKLFLPSSLQTLPSKSLRHTLLSNSTESFTNTNNS